MKFLILLKTFLIICCLSESVSRKSLINRKQTNNRPSILSLYPVQNGKETCGLSRDTGPGQRIIGGRLARDGEFPWQISLHKNGIFRCGGSIIDSRSIVTAAHCVQGSSPAEFKIIYNSLLQSSGGSEMNVSKIIIHPNYNNTILDNDIAILHLTRDLILNRTNAGSICLPSASDRTSAGDIVTVTGWGLTESNKTSLVLKTIDVPIVSLTTCQYQYKNLPISLTITDNMICAGLMNGGEDACKGDSGGPMIKSFGRPIFVLIGIVSKGFGCALPNTPGVYTRVANYVDWINQNKI